LGFRYVAAGDERPETCAASCKEEHALEETEVLYADVEYLGSGALAFGPDTQNFQENASPCLKPKAGGSKQ